jgi:hypothetical protein
MLLRGVVLLRLQPGQQWVTALQEAVLQQLGCLAPRDISQVGNVVHSSSSSSSANLPGVWVAILPS